MLSSIRIQLITVFLALITLILAQGFIARKNQDVLSKGVSSAAKAVVNVGIVKELERDVVDLQRNVLIFKENASKSAITRFNRLMVTINSKLDTLDAAERSKEKEGDRDILSRMRDHLNAYQENFSQVVNARSERDNLIAQGTLSDITYLNGLLDEALTTNEVSPVVVEEAKAYLMLAENAMLKYLMKPDMRFVQSFNEAADSLKSLKPSEDERFQQRMDTITTKIKADFFKSIGKATTTCK